MTVTEILDDVRTLSLDDRKQLAKALVDLLTESEPATQQRSILELAGLGAEIWQRIDTDRYIHDLRDEWEHRL
jgi:hypothetical protein